MIGFSGLFYIGTPLLLLLASYFIFTSKKSKPLSKKVSKAAAPKTVATVKPVTLMTESTESERLPLPDEPPEALLQFKLLTIDNLDFDSKKRIWDLADNIKKPNNLQSVFTMGDDPALYTQYVTGDPELAAYILRIVNSAYYGLQNKITSIHHAVMYLGTSNVKSIILRANLEDSFVAKTPEQHFAYQLFWFTGLLSSHLTQKLANYFQLEDANTLATLALLVTVGKLSLITSHPEAAQQHSDTMGFLNACAFEQSEYGFNALSVAARIFTLWGLPDSFVDNSQALFHILLQHPDKMRLPENTDGAQLLVLYASIRLSEHIVQHGIENISDIKLEQLNPVDTFYLKEYLRYFNLQDIEKALGNKAIQESTRQIITSMKPKELRQREEQAE